MELIFEPVTISSSVQERQIRLVGGGVIDFWSLEHVDAGRGRKYGRVVVDEAGVVRDLETAWQQAIRPTLTDLRGDAWFLGTPKGRRHFFTLYQRGQSGDAEWASWRFPTGFNPYIDPAEVPPRAGTCRSQPTGRSSRESPRTTVRPRRGPGGS